MQRRYSWSYRSALSATAKLWSRLFNIPMQDVTWLVFVKTFWTRITFVFFLGRHYHQICHQLNIYGMNTVDVLTTGNTTRAAWGTCARVEQHRTSLFPTIDWFYASEMRSYRWWKRWSHMLLNSEQTSILHDNFCLSMICSDNDVEKLCWYCFICNAYMNINYTIFVDFIFSL